MTIDHNKLVQAANRAGNTLAAVFHHLALFAIGATTVWAAAMTFVGLLDKSHATIADILLLFIYLEIGAMVGIYFRTNHMPVRFLLYIAITALTRHMVDTVSHIPVNTNEMLAVAGATLVMAISVLIVRFTSWRFPANRDHDPG
jgi:phosphate starvation-inducible membrane PsiE